MAGRIVFTVERFFGYYNDISFMSRNWNVSSLKGLASIKMYRYWFLETPA